MDPVARAEAAPPLRTNAETRSDARVGVSSTYGLCIGWRSAVVHDGGRRGAVRCFTTAGGMARCGASRRSALAQRFTSWPARKTGDRRELALSRLADRRGPETGFRIPGICRAWNTHRETSGAHARSSCRTHALIPH